MLGLGCVRYVGLGFLENPLLGGVERSLLDPLVLGAVRSLSVVVGGGLIHFSWCWGLYQLGCLVSGG